MKTQWKVVIPTGRATPGTHLFKTCKAACAFANEWAANNPLPNGESLIHAAQRVRS